MTNERLNEHVQGLYIPTNSVMGKKTSLCIITIYQVIVATGKIELFSFYILTTMPQILIVVW